MPTRRKQRWSQTWQQRNGANAFRAISLGATVICVLIGTLQTRADEGEARTTNAQNSQEANHLSKYPQVPLGWRKVSLEWESDGLFDLLEPVPDPGVSDPNRSIPFEVDPPPCPEWDGESVYCDVIAGTIIVLATPDSEKIWLKTQNNEVNGILGTLVQVTHSDGTLETFEFTTKDILVSDGIFADEPPPGYWPTVYVEADCGDDVVINNTLFSTHVFLGAGDDTYVGSNHVDTVFGEWGDDTIFGGREADNISGGPGRDRLVGGTPVDWMIPFPGFFTWPWNAVVPPAVTIDGARDVIDCGEDSDRDVVLLETLTSPDGLLLVIDEVLNVDWNSPPGTDQVVH